MTQYWTGYCRLFKGYLQGHSRIPDRCLGQIPCMCLESPLNQTCDSTGCSPLQAPSDSSFFPVQYCVYLSKIVTSHLSSL